MRHRLIVLFFLFRFGQIGVAQEAAQHAFSAANGHFTLDGKPFRVIPGEMHYPRIPREYWRDRLRMAREMGLNTITTNVVWKVHEPRPGVYDFAGNKRCS